MRRLVILLTVAFVSAATLGSAQSLSIETAMRGNTLVGAPTSSTAWANNPAGLADLARHESETQLATGWRHAGSAAFELSGDSDLFAINWGGAQIGKGYGLGAGYADAWSTRLIGIGFGKAWGRKNIDWGVNWSQVSPDGGDDEDRFDLGVRGEWGGWGISTVAPARFGAVARDVLGEPSLDLGAVFELRGGIKLYADVADVTDRWDRTFHFGATQRYGPEKQFELGAGLSDGNLTLGLLWDAHVGWNGATWRFGAAWQESESGDNSLIAGATATWGM